MFIGSSYNLKKKICYHPQSRAARVMTGATYDIRSADVLETLSWEYLNARRFYIKPVFIYKILNNYTAPTLKESFHKISEYQKTYNLRSTKTDFSKKALDIAVLCFGII